MVVVVMVVVVVVVVLVVVTIFPRLAWCSLFMVLVFEELCNRVSKKFVSLFVRGRGEGEVKE